MFLKQNSVLKKNDFYNKLVTSYDQRKQYLTCQFAAVKLNSLGSLKEDLIVVNKVGN